MAAQSQENVESYLRSADYNLLNAEPGFIVADKPGVGGDRDTLLVWLPTEIYPGRSFGQFEPSFIDKIEVAVEHYPDARYTILVDSLEGISRTFSEIASGHGVKIRVPVQFFDAPFRAEESPDAVSAVKELTDLSFFTKRVPQPYSQQQGTSSALDGGPDLLTDLREEIISQTDLVFGLLWEMLARANQFYSKAYLPFYIAILSTLRISSAFHPGRSHSCRNTCGQRTRSVPSRS
jgi:hypothetical protein